MTTPKTTPSLPTGRIPTEAMRTTNEDTVVLKNIYCIPVWRDEKIAWFDIYKLSNGWYVGKRFTLEECEEVCLTLTN